jgi:hypothetical protein
MGETTDYDIVIHVDTVEQLFNAPAINPFRENEIYVLGETALTRASRRMLSVPLRDSSRARLVIRLPAAAITPDLEQQTAAAVRRYTQAKIEDNNLTARLARTRGLVGLLIVGVVSVLLVSLTTMLLGSGGLGETAQGFVLSFVGILAWVMLWDPLSKLLFEWVEPWVQNRMFRRLGAMPVILLPQESSEQTTVVAAPARALS